MSKRYSIISWAYHIDIQLLHHTHTHMHACFLAKLLTSTLRCCRNDERRLGFGFNGCWIHIIIFFLCLFIVYFVVFIGVIFNVFRLLWPNLSSSNFVCSMICSYDNDISHTSAVYTVNRLCAVVRPGVHSILTYYSF